MSRVTHSEPGLPMLFHHYFYPDNFEVFFSALTDFHYMPNILKVRIRKKCLERLRAEFSSIFLDKRKIEGDSARKNHTEKSN